MMRRDNRRDESNRIKLVCFILFFINFKLKPNFYLKMQKVKTGCKLKVLCWGDNQGVGGVFAVFLTHRTAV